MRLRNRSPYTLTQHADDREILNRRQIDVVKAMLHKRCTNVIRSKVERMKVVAE